MKKIFIIVSVLAALTICSGSIMAGTSTFSEFKTTVRDNKGASFSTFAYKAPLAKITNTAKDTFGMASGSTFGDIAGDEFTVFMRNTAYAGTDSGFVKLTLEIGGDSAGYFIPDTTETAKVIKAKWDPGTTLTICLADYIRTGINYKRWRIIAEKGTNFQATDSVSISKEVTRKQYVK